MNKYIKKLPGGDFKVEHTIDDPNGVAKQYPKVMKNPRKHGFLWEPSQIFKHYSIVKYVKTGD